MSIPWYYAKQVIIIMIWLLSFFLGILFERKKIGIIIIIFIISNIYVMQPSRFDKTISKWLIVWNKLLYFFLETYADDSRIPEMNFGTPIEDAMRRDLTINSLFYNIHTKLVEDFSTRGVADLRSGQYERKFN